MAAAPPGAGAGQNLEQPGAAASTVALPATPSQPVILMPPMMKVCDDAKNNSWAGFTIQQRDLPVPDYIPTFESSPVAATLEKRRYRNQPARILCIKLAEFDFFDHDQYYGNTQTITLRKNIKYTLIVYASSKVKEITTYTSTPGSGWQKIRPTKMNAELVSYDTWVEYDQNGHFKITFDTKTLPVHGKAILYQLPIAPSGPEG